MHDGSALATGGCYITTLYCTFAEAELANDSGIFWRILCSKIRMWLTPASQVSPRIQCTSPRFCACDRDRVFPCWADD